MERMRLDHDEHSQKMRAALSKMADMQAGFETLKSEIDKFNSMAISGAFGAGGGGGDDFSMKQSLDRVQEGQAAHDAKLDLFGVEINNIKVSFI